MGAKTTLQNPKGPISGAEAVVRSLVAEGANLIYGYPGGAIMPVYDELYKFQDHINHVLVRHEQGAAHAAQGLLECLVKWESVWQLLALVQQT